MVRELLAQLRGPLIPFFVPTRPINCELVGMLHEARPQHELAAADRHAEQDQAGPDHPPQGDRRRQFPRRGLGQVLRRWGDQGRIHEDEG